MKNIESVQKISVLHCVYQTIASADGSIDENRDRMAIDFAMSELGLIEGNYWYRSLRFNPHDAFIHLSSMSDDNKQLFRKLLFQISEMNGNTAFRKSCANHIIQLANCQ